MSAGWRASVMACAVVDFGKPGWLVTGLKNHGKALADPKFYSYHGNHALNQVIGLDRRRVRPCQPHLEVPVGVTGLGARPESVDSEGVSNEQAIGYQLYN